MNGTHSFGLSGLIVARSCHEKGRSRLERQLYFPNWYLQEGDTHSISWRTFHKASIVNYDVRWIGRYETLFLIFVKWYFKGLKGRNRDEVVSTFIFPRQFFLIYLSPRTEDTASGSRNSNRDEVVSTLFFPRQVFFFDLLVPPRTPPQEVEIRIEMRLLAPSFSLANYFF